MFVCDFGVKGQFLSVIIQRFYLFFEFTTVEPLAVYEFPDLCDELSGLFESHFFASYVSEIHLLCTYKGFINEA